MTALQKYALNLSMSPILLKTFFAGASSPVEPDKCVLDRLQLIWGGDGEQEVTVTPLLIFPRSAISASDLAGEMQNAIEYDLEQLNAQADRDSVVLFDPSQNHLSCEELNIVNPYLTENINAVDTVYRLTMPDRKYYDLFVMRECLLQQFSEQIEIGITKAMRGIEQRPPQVAALFRPKMAHVPSQEYKLSVSS